MVDLLQSAINNNVGLYRAVLGRLGIALNDTPELAWTDKKVPPYYSNAVTVSARWRPDGAFDRISMSAEEAGWADWSIKDSYDVLDLAPHGFERLFRASWVHLDPSRLRPPGHPVRPLRFELVRDEDGLSGWRRAWDADHELGRALFGPELPSDPDLHFVAGFEGSRLVCGCLFNRTADVLGISNFFAKDEPSACWAAAVSFILDRLGPSGVVGYARKAVLFDFQAIGFKPVGHLSVWHRPTRSRTQP